MNGRILKFRDYFSVIESIHIGGCATVGAGGIIRLKIQGVTRMTRKRTLFATFAVLALISAPLHGASILNGSFETSDQLANPPFDSWSTLGPAVPQTVQPTEGLKHAFLDTFGSATTTSDLETALQLTGNPLDTIGGLGASARGAAIWQINVLVNADDKLLFDLNFLTDEATPLPLSLKGFAFFSWSSGSEEGATKLVDTTAGSLGNSPGTQFNSETGYIPYMHTFTVGGTYRLGFGVVGDGAVRSGIFLDNVRFVPLPAAAWMALPLFGGLGVIQIIRHRKLAA